MKRIPILLVIATLMFGLTSCFEIREKIELNKNGSGTYSLIIDLSEMKSMIEAMNPDGDVTEGSPFNEMEEDFVVTRDLLSEIDGISNVNFYAENEGFKVVTSFDFKEMEALNQAIQVVYDPEAETDASKTFYSFKRKKFSCMGESGYLEDLRNEMNSQEMDVESFDFASIFGDVTYTSEVKFNGRKVRKVLSGNPHVAEDDQSLENVYYIFKEDMDQQLDFSVKLK